MNDTTVLVHHEHVDSVFQGVKALSRSVVYTDFISVVSILTLKTCIVFPEHQRVSPVFLSENRECNIPWVAECLTGKIALMFFTDHYTYLVIILFAVVTVFLGFPHRCSYFCVDTRLLFEVYLFLLLKEVLPS